VAALLATLAGAAGLAHADATFTVNSTADLSDLNPGDGLCATAPPLGLCTLRAAVEEVNGLVRGVVGNAGQYTIVLPADVYTIVGELDIALPNAGLQIKAIGGTATIAGASVANSSSRIFSIEGLDPASRVSMDGLTIKRSLNPGTTKGAMVYNSNCQLSLFNCTMQGNVALDGGAIFNDSGGDLTVLQSTIGGNTAISGGAIYNLGSATLSRSALQGNQAGDPRFNNGEGGAIDNLGSMRLDNCIIGSNLSYGVGGAIRNSGSLVIDFSTMSGNFVVGDGGTFYNTPTGFLAISTSTLSGNTASRNGGGLWNSGDVSLTSDTITQNIAADHADPTGHGGGIFFTSGTVRAANTIIAGNSDMNPSPSNFPDCLGALTSQGYNLIGNTNGCSITGTTTGNIVNVGARLGPLQNNGGITVGLPNSGVPPLTHGLLQGSLSCSVVNFRQICIYLPPSPAIDAGNGCGGLDERDFMRPADGNGDKIARCDIGAFELSLSTPTTKSLGTFSVMPADATVAVGDHVTYTFAWTVPEGDGWRTLDDLQFLIGNEEDVALVLRFQEVDGSPGTLGLLHPTTGTLGPTFPPGRPNRLETNAATVYLADSFIDGPPGRTVTLTLDVAFKPKAAGHTYGVDVLAEDHAGTAQGFAHAGTVTVVPAGR
jgi:CSLREA domain-containing protein